MKHFSIINFLLFQASWALAALFPANAPFWMLLGFAIHFWLTPTRRADAILMIAAFLGIFADQIMVHLDVLNVSQTWLPIWLILLWGHFILCLNHSLAWLQKLPYPLQALLGGIFGSLSYWMGLNVNAFTTSLDKTHFIFIYVLLWAILLPIFNIWAQFSRKVPG